ncbi:MAG: hypothetical protein MK226_00765 [Saprospiraceae bacterium]|nr:hypothetical protein [Saprospiraceae bacterium]
MRKLILTIITWGIVVGISAQNCNPYFPFEKGRVLKYQHFDSKGKLINSSRHTIREINQLETATGPLLGANVELFVTDQEGDSILTHEYQVICKDDVLFMDVMDIIGPQLTVSFLHMDLDIKGDALIIPNKLVVGTQLPDAQTFIQGSAKGVNVLSMEFVVKQRRVEGKEQLKIGEKAFDSFRLSYKMDVLMTIKKSFKVVQWFTKENNIGLIRTEIYNPFQRLEGYSQLVVK